MPYGAYNMCMTYDRWCRTLGAYDSLAERNSSTNAKQRNYRPTQGRIHGLKTGGRIMASARNEAPRGWGVRSGAPSPPGKRSREVAMPPPQICFPIFQLKMASFGAFCIKIYNKNSHRYCIRFNLSSLVWNGCCIWPTIGQHGLSQDTGPLVKPSAEHYQYLPTMTVCPTGETRDLVCRLWNK